MGPDENEESATDLEAWAGAAPGTQVVRRPRRRRLGAEVTKEVAALARRPRHRDRRRGGNEDGEDRRLDEVDGVDFGHGQVMVIPAPRRTV